MDLSPKAAQARTAGGQLSLREISCSVELLPLLRLRQLVYSHQGYLDASSRRIDVDCYDRHSRFVGAYYQDGQGIEEMIGGVRLILAEGEPNGAALDELLAQERHPVPDPRKRAYAAQEQMDFDEVVSWSRESGRQLVEFGRLVIHPDWQKSKFGPHLVYAIYGLALINGIDLGLALIPSRLLGFYTRCGCRLLERLGSIHYMKHEVVPIAVDLRALGDGQREAVSAAEAMRNSGSWTVPLHDRQASA
jgi:GNAT superfamily N-acetyltransferase